MVRVAFYERGVSATRTKRLARTDLPGDQVLPAIRWAVASLEATDATLLARVVEVRVSIIPPTTEATQ